MSSSFRLYKRRQDKDVWTIPGDSQAHYIRVVGECHPDYTALPIGNPDGVKICTRTTPEMFIPPRPDPELGVNRYFKFASRLYEPWNPDPVQMRNPSAYKDRFGPHQGYYLAHDYYRSEVKYDGIGGYPMPTCYDKALYEYGVAQIPDPPPFEINRLHQLKPMWDESVRYHTPSVEAVEQPCQNIDLGVASEPQKHCGP